MDQSILRAIQQQIRRVECRLDNPRTGLAEIKSEVAAIECAIRDLDMHGIVCRLKALDEQLEDVLEAVDEVEDKLDSPRSGLDAIKHEIEEIERAVACLNLTPVLGLLNQIKHEVHEIESRLDNPEFGLREIKEEVRGIEEAIQDQKRGLPEVLEEVKEVEDLLESPEFGLEEIKREVSAIECKLENLNIQQLLSLLASVKGVALCIQQKLENPEFGLEEIKEEVSGIEETLCDPRYGLREIKDEVEDLACLFRKLDLEETLALLGAVEAELSELSCRLDHICFPAECLEKQLHQLQDDIDAIEAKLDHPDTGLAEIKSEVAEILAGMAGGVGVTYLTTGPVLRANGSNSIVAAVINNSAAAQNITVSAFSRLPSQGGLPGSPANLNVPAVTAAAVLFDLPAAVTVYEVRASYVAANSVTLFSASRTQNAAAPLASSTLLPENTIRNAEFRPFTTGG